MKRLIKLSSYFLLVSLLISISGCVDDTSTPSDDIDIKQQNAFQNDILYQVSTIDALLDGLYGGQMSIAELKGHGDTGLGTFDRLDGEMIVVDREVYQMKADGVAYPVEDSATTPFAAVTYFEVDELIVLDDRANSSEVTGLIEEILPSENIMYAIRINGTFEQMKVRSVPAQEEPYPLLVDVIKEEQAVFELENVEGNIVGFWLPYYVEGINVPGYHFHFIDGSREKGGHVLDYVVLNGTVSVDHTTEFELSIPESPEFMDADLSRDNSNDLHIVEKDEG
ncbi:acetolactate decarboxylase [Methanococcoides sp. FTZ1]|uniref:acetolactate decarboxylase n=1 Tax=Methanococcoides sp. FTZ1 TaxID=3439061 RepID=UPI003F83EA3E